MGGLVSAGRRTIRYQRPMQPGTRAGRSGEEAAGTHCSLARGRRAEEDNTGRRASTKGARRCQEIRAIEARGLLCWMVFLAASVVQTANKQEEGASAVSSSQESRPETQLRQGGKGEAVVSTPTILSRKLPLQLAV